MKKRLFIFLTSALLALSFGNSHALAATCVPDSNGLCSPSVTTDSGQNASADTSGATLGNGPAPTPTTFTQSTNGSVSPDAVGTIPSGPAGGAALTPYPGVTSYPASQFGNVTPAGNSATGGATLDNVSASQFSGTGVGTANPTLNPPKPTPTCTLGGGNLCYTPLEPLLTVDYNQAVSPNGLGPIINSIFKILITVGALMAVLMLTIGGVQYMVSGGPADKNKGIGRAKAALWAILILAASWLILFTINPNLLNFSLNPCAGLPVGSCGVTASPSPTTANPNAQNIACATNLSNCIPANNLANDAGVQAAVNGGPNAQTPTIEQQTIYQQDRATASAACNSICTSSGGCGAAQFGQLTRDQGSPTINCANAGLIKQEYSSCTDYPNLGGACFYNQ